MKSKKWILNFPALFIVQLILALPLIAGDNNVSDIALSPGADATKLNLTWHTNSAFGTCDVKIDKGLLSFSRRFSGGAKVSAGTDENGIADYYCKVAVTDLEESTNYVYQLGDGQGNWSDEYDYSTKDQNEYGFFYVADSQIGASGPKSYSTSDAKSYIANYYLTQNYATVIADATLAGKVNTYLTAQNKSSLATAYLKTVYPGYPEKVSADLALYTANTLVTTNPTLDTAIDTYVAAGIADLLADFTSGTQADQIATMVLMYTSASGPTKYLPSTYHNAILALYNAYKADTTANLAGVAALEATYNVASLASNLVANIAAVVARQKAATANDTDGWVTTVEIANEQFPEAAFMLSGGDQAENNTKEWEWTGYFSPYELTSLPVAPTYGSHDTGVNINNHFNLPNVSAYSANTTGADYYFTHGNALIMVLNMDKTSSAYPMDTPPGGAGAPPPGGGGDTVDTTDTDGDGVYDSADSCPATPSTDAVDTEGCTLAVDGDMDSDGTLNGTRTAGDQCNNTVAAYLEFNDVTTGCPYNDTDNDGIPDEKDLCNNTYDDKTVDVNGCADTSYITTDEEFATAYAALEVTPTDSTTDDPTKMKLDDFKASIADHTAFMQETMAANPDVKWKIAVWHYSIYSAGNHASDSPIRATKKFMVPLMDQYDIDVVLMAHDHVYTRTYQMLGNEPQPTQTTDETGKIVYNPTGTLYVTGATSSGSKYYGLNGNTATDSSSNWYFDYMKVGIAPGADVGGTPSFSYLTVTDESLKISTYNYTTDAATGSYTTSLMDEYTLVHGDPPVVPEEPVVTPEVTPVDNRACFIATTALDTSLMHKVAVVSLLFLIVIAGGCVVYRRRIKGNI